MGSRSDIDVTVAGLQLRDGERGEADKGEVDREREGEKEGEQEDKVERERDGDGKRGGAGREEKELVDFPEDTFCSSESGGIYSYTCICTLITCIEGYFIGTHFFLQVHNSRTALRISQVVLIS